MAINKKLVDSKLRKDKIWNWTTFGISVGLSILFILILIFIIISAIPGIKEFGNKNILGTTEFNLADGKAGVWSPIAITLLLTFGAILIATPIGIKTATFIKFRVHKKYQKTFSIIVQALSGIPSVIFGLFAINSLGKVVCWIFGTNGSYTIINAIIMLSFMILPTIIALTLNTYDGISDTLVINPISLGLTKTSSIYKVFKKEAKNGVVVAVIIAIGRAFGETMALSMLLTSEAYSILGDGIIATLNSSLGTLGSVIATNMFSETGGEGLRGVLYTFGIILFIFVMLLNGFILFMAKKSKKKRKWWANWENKIAEVILWVPNTICNFISNLYIDSKLNPNYNPRADVPKYTRERIKNHKLANARTIWWFSWEIICTAITFGFLVWICLDIIIGGMAVLTAEPNYDPNFTGYNQTAFKYGLDTTGQAFINTLIIILVSLAISIPLALLIAIYLNEYAKNKKIKKTILFFVDCLGSSPSIIFGMFGLAVFIEMFGLSMNGAMGRSLLAGALTISIVILPSLIRTLQQALESVPDIIRINAYSLGCTKWEIIWKVVFKHAYRSMMSAVVLAIGRIMAETAPLYLTAGLTSVPGIGLMMPGQTLTTRIYAQLAGEKTLSASVGVQYECAFIALMIVIILIWLGNYVIPNSRKIKRDIKNFFMSIKNFFVYCDSKLVKKYHKQIIGRTLYLTKQQAEDNKIDSNQFKFICYKNRTYRIKYVKPSNLEKLQGRVFVKEYNY